MEAYWVGNDLLNGVGMRPMGDSLESRFRDRIGRPWDRLVDTVLAGAAPHHSFHVLGVHPWFGLLRQGRTPEPLRVLDRCRVRWGRVVSVAGTEAVVLSRPLLWDGRSLYLGEPREERAMVGVDGLGWRAPSTQETGARCTGSGCASGSHPGSSPPCDTARSPSSTS